MARSFEERVRRYAAASLVLPDAERGDLAKTAEVLKKFLKDRAEQLVRRADSRPVLLSYCGDGTPLQTRETFTAAVGERAKKIRGVGGCTNEFLVQHLFVRFLDSGEAAHTSVVLQDPLPLTHGKGSLAVFSAAEAFLLDPRALGHRGVVIWHFGSTAHYSPPCGVSGSCCGKAKPQRVRTAACPRHPRWTGCSQARAACMTRTTRCAGLCGRVSRTQPC